MSESCKFLDCKNHKAANLVMIHLPDYLVGFYHKNKAQTTQTVVSQLSSIGRTDPAERSPLTYVAGYIVAKIYKSMKITRPVKLHLIPHKRWTGQSIKRFRWSFRTSRVRIPTTSEREKIDFEKYSN